MVPQPARARRSARLVGEERGRGEELIGPPKWPWLVDTNLAAQGKAVFDRPTNQGGCVACHGIAAGDVRLLNEQTWKTPTQNVGTDTREYDVMAWTAKAGVLEGGKMAMAFNMLRSNDLIWS